MRPTLHNPVPSSSLLKFLRLQSESLCFFSPNPRPGFIFDHAAPRGPLPRSHVSLTTSKSSSRRLSTAAVGHATIEAGFLNLDFLWPHAASEGLLPKLSGNVARIKEPGCPNALPSQRHTYSSHSVKWHEKLWGPASKKGGRPLQPDDLPGPLGSLMEDGSDSIFSKGRSISAKAAAQPILRCTELNENGNVVLASGEFKKSELIAKVFHS
jgi:magnesium transporter